MKNPLRLAAPVAILGLAAAFVRAADTPMEAVAVVHPTAGQQATGTVHFSQTGKTVTVTGTVTGLTPSTQHGFHVHQYGDCSAPDASSAGDHFSPTPEPHAAPTAEKRHAGDLGNIASDANGTATINVRVEGVTLAGENGFIGRGLIVHANPDDLTTQPSGNAGPRVACGAIGVAKPAAH